MFNDIQQLYLNVKELEDRYYHTAIAWEKELRELISKCNSKSQKIVKLETKNQEILIDKSEL
jgi:hypothetical protein